MRKLKKYLLPLLMLTTFFSSESCIAAEQVSICGTGDSQLLLRVLGKKFEADHPDITINVPDSVGSGGGIRAVVKGRCDLARVARPLQEREKHFKLTYWLFARSPIAFVLHPSMERPRNLTGKQINGIYSGNLERWDQAGGDKGKIYVINREEGDSSRHILEKNLPGFSDIERFSGRVFYTTHEALEGIKSHRQTIAYIPLSLALTSNLPLLSVDGIIPTTANVRSGAYKLVTPFGLAWKREPQGVVKTFLEYLKTPAAQAIMLEYGAIAVTQSE
ncbi:MAG: hypothetical protein OI74_15430 [Gammaproteobacteria bacterium (ex Lamellibrachia satsuma)]|nr:MAG: hypothetical protein HPY30_17315 [Gammaproteobacteria bacterium (ex Lamellibrachia satsuma)]RRS31095.1 MAG: hypothetical protein OI74_15430 [Gammaproteobacteria bacterium (ex Lamellibrachia satsuma)]RRS36705.1 MAG: hypothetical protein NV67_05495 [Gammaproteobacteria bacterium (ex Lamellibrachia satsuma)]